MSDRERRYFNSKVEYRAASETGGLPVIRGYAALWNVDSELQFSNRDGIFIERIAPNAFTWNEVVATFNHDENMPLARYRGSEKDSLRLGQDEQGLWYEFTPADTQAGRDLVALLQNEIVYQSSFGMFVEPGGDEWERKSNPKVRTIKKAIVFDCGPVTYPAFNDTKAQVSFRSYQEACLQESMIALMEAKQKLFEMMD